MNLGQKLKSLLDKGMNHKGAVEHLIKNFSKTTIDFGLNKSGSIGIQPDYKRDKNGVRKYETVRLGRLGKINIPTPDVRGAEDDFPMVKRRTRKF